MEDFREARKALDDDLLTLLDAIVKADPAPPGMAGSVAIGVRDNDRERWWMVHLSEVAFPIFFPVRPRVDAALLMGKTEADSILKTGNIPPAPELLRISGDRQLVVRFAERYLAQQNIHSVRCKKGQER